MCEVIQARIFVEFYMQTNYWDQWRDVIFSIIVLY
jgi:hypothetical protein